MKQHIRHTALVILAGLGLAAGGPAEGIIADINSDFDRGDSDARRELRQMSMDIMTPPLDEGERAIHETDLLNGLNSNVHVTVKQLLLREIQLVGKSPSIAPLSALLDDDDLYEDAVLALIPIYHATSDAAALAAIRDAMASASGNKLMTLMKAAGSLRDEDAATQAILQTNATSSNQDVRMTALRSLANIGDPGARQILADAISADDMYEKSKVIAWNLLYAERLAARGSKTEATEVCNEINTLAENTDLHGSRSSCHVVEAAAISLDTITKIVVSVKNPEGKHSYKAPEVEFMVDKGLRIVVTSGQPYVITISDLKGRSLWNKKGDRPASFRLPGGIFVTGIYTVSVKSGNRKPVRKNLLVQ